MHESDQTLDLRIRIIFPVPTIGSTPTFKTGNSPSDKIKLITFVHDTCWGNIGVVTNVDGPIDAD